MTKTVKWIFIVVGFLLIAAIIALLVGSWIAPLLGDAGMQLRRFLNAPLFELGKQPLTSLSLIKIALFIICLGLVARFSMGFLQKRLLIHTHLEKGQQYAIARVISYLIFAVGLVIGLESLGLDLSSLVVLGGAVGLGVGLGLQTVVSNFVAGLILLLEQPVRVGDRIEVGGVYGEVIALRGRSTWVRTNDNVIIIVPNSNFIEQNVTNWTANDRRVRINLKIGVSYDSDPEQVRSTLLRIASVNEDVLAEPPADVIFHDFGDSSLDFELRVWTEAKVNIPQVLKSDLYFVIFAEFRKLQIELPFPQHDLHLRSVSDSAADKIARRVQA